MTKENNTADYIKKTAKQTFNEAWKYLDKKKLTNAEKINLLNVVHTSFYLWQQVPECKATNISISLWQISRAYAHIGDGANALLYAEENIKLCKKENTDGFYTAYAHESAVRAYITTGNKEKAASHVKHALNSIKTSAEKHLDDFNKDMNELKTIL